MRRRRVSENQQTTEEELPVEEESQVIDFSKPDYSFTPKGTHLYRQQGPYLVCKTCELEHATFIGMNKIMIGIAEDGQPILKSRKDM